MNIIFSTEQKLLRESAEKFFVANPILNRLSHVHPHGYDEKTWSAMAELGWLAVGIPEEFGGLGGGAVETAILMEQMGRNLLISPYLSSAVMGTRAVAAHGSHRQKSELLPALAVGDLQLSVASIENGSCDLAAVQTSAERVSGGYRLSGRKSHVLFGSSAHKFVVSAVTGYLAVADIAELTLFIVDADAPGLVVSSTYSLDGGIVSELTLDAVFVEEDAILGPIDKGANSLAVVENAAVAAVCAEASGCMRATLDDTVSYLKARKQFGQPLSSFQALQHRLVDMFMRCEFSESLALLAAVELSKDSDAKASNACSTAKYLVGEYAKLNAEDGIQLHGAMGMMQELPVGHYYKRIVMIENMLGSGFWHLEQLAAHAAAA